MRYSLFRKRNQEVNKIMSEKFAKLIDLKSFITLSFSWTLVGIILFKLEVADNVFQLFQSALMLILGFYFGKNIKGTPSNEGER